MIRLTARAQLLPRVQGHAVDRTGSALQPRTPATNIPSFLLAKFVHAGAVYAADAMAISPSASIATRLTVVTVRSPIWMAALTSRGDPSATYSFGRESLDATTWVIVPSQRRTQQSEVSGSLNPSQHCLSSRAFRTLIGPYPDAGYGEHQPLIASYRRASAAHIARLAAGAAAGRSYFQAVLRAATERRASQSQGQYRRPRARA
jgi:hypothetical protein